MTNITSRHISGRLKNGGQGQQIFLYNSGIACNAICSLFLLITLGFSLAKTSVATSNTPSFPSTTHVFNYNYSLVSSVTLASPFKIFGQALFYYIFEKGDITRNSIGKVFGFSLFSLSNLISTGFYSNKLGLGNILILSSYCNICSMQYQYCQHFATCNNIACSILLQYRHAAATTGL